MDHRVKPGGDEVSSLRAKRSNLVFQRQALDCFVACAPRNDAQHPPPLRWAGEVQRLVPQPRLLEQRQRFVAKARHAFDPARPGEQDAVEAGAL
jgi:hypothetical protein